MRRLFLSLVLCLGLTAPAHAARAWSTDPFPACCGAYTALSVAPDGTRVSAIMATGSASGVLAKIGEGPVQDLGPFLTFDGGLVATAGSGGNAAVAWSPDFHLGPFITSCPAGGCGNITFPDADSTNETTNVAFARPDGTFAAPVDLGVGIPVAVAMNAAGDTALVMQRYQDDQPVALSERFRPAGGDFGPAVDLPADNLKGLVLLPDDTAVIALESATHGPGLDDDPDTGGVFAYERAGSGALAGPTVLSADGGPCRLANDARRRVIAACAAAGGSAIATAVRDTDGTWTAPRPFSLETTVYPASVAVASDAAGDAVIGWRDVIAAYPTSARGAAVHVATASLSDGVITSAVVLDRDALGSGPAIGSAPDGSTLVAWGDVDGRGVLASRRTGTGAFGPPEWPACDGGNSDPGLAAFLTPAGDAWLQVNLSVLRDAPAATATTACGGPEATPTGTQPAITPARVMVGKTVNIDDSGIRTPDSDLDECDWQVDDAAPRQTAVPAFDHVFSTPGTHRVRLHCSEVPRFGGSARQASDTYRIDVFAPAALAVPGRLDAQAVLRRGVPVQANAFTATRARVLLTLRGHGRVLGRSRRTLGAELAGVRLPLNAAGRRAARRGVHGRVILRQAGRVVGIQRVWIR